MYGRGYVFLTRDDLNKAIQERAPDGKSLNDDGTANTWDVSAITDMSALFNMSGFDEDISNWDTSNVTTMERMFHNSTFNKPLPWNVSNVTNMKGMFKGGFSCVFNQDISKWDVSNVTTMEEMFFENKDFNQLLEWNTSSVTNMKKMFNRSIYNQHLPWDVSRVENMEGMFQLSKFNEDISGWTTSSVTNMKEMFNSSAFNQDISKWDVAYVTTMNRMFFNSQFNQDISEWDVEEVTDMFEMFRYSKFNQNISKWHIRRDSNMVDMFSDSLMDERNKPPSAVFPDKEIKKKITIWVNLHGSNLQTKLPDGLPLHTSIAARPGTCTFWFKETPTKILEKIEEKKVIYKDKPIHAGNDIFAEKFQPFNVSMFDENESEVLKGSPKYDREDLRALHQERTSPLRSLVYDRSYSLENDDAAGIMGIFIINAQDSGREVVFEYPKTITTSDEFTDDYLELQKKNLLNVDVAKHILPEGFRRSDVVDDFTNILHYEKITLSDILLFFGKLGYDYVNIIDDACRGGPSVPSLDRSLSQKERELHGIFGETFPGKGGTRKYKNKTKYYVQRNNLRNTRNNRRHKRHTQNRRS